MALAIQTSGTRAAYHFCPPRGFNWQVRLSCQKHRRRNGFPPSPWTRKKSGKTAQRILTSPRLPRVAAIFTSAQARRMKWYAGCV
jgi:hypothetical protein